MYALYGRLNYCVFAVRWQKQNRTFIPGLGTSGRPVDVHMTANTASGTVSVAQEWSAAVVSWSVVVYRCSTDSCPAFLAVLWTSRHWRQRCRTERPEWPWLFVQALVKHKDATAHTLQEQHYTFQKFPFFTPLLSPYIHLGLPRKLSLRFFLSRPFKNLQWWKYRKAGMLLNWERTLQAHLLCDTLEESNMGHYGLS